jgi:aminoglycoside phosphotransferase family enzyme
MKIYKMKRPMTSGFLDMVSSNHENDHGRKLLLKKQLTDPSEEAVIA